MPVCPYCGKDVGIFRSYHPECRRKHDWACIEIRAAVLHAVTADVDIDEGRERVLQLAVENHVGAESRIAALRQGWADAVERLLDDSVLTRGEEERLMSVRRNLLSDDTELEHTREYLRVVKAGLLRDLFEGQISRRMVVEGPLPFQFQKNETLVWLFNSARYWEERIQRTYVGGSSGVSIRIARGVYYRTAGFRGNPVETRSLVEIGVGSLAVTTKRLYFASQAKSFRVAYSRVVAWEAYEDGIGLWRDVANAKQQVFVTGDGWFTYNLVRNLAEQG